tara:strand:- start:724757 stop:726019 length:1263 start_codon:yes stop_codon:yes gene_type:complete
MRLIYSIAWWFALPLVLCRLLIRGQQEPGYRQHVGERLGFYRVACKGPTLWVHAVSVGETRAAQPLIDAMLQTYPQHSIVLTHMTPTGRATGRALFGNNPRVIQSYLPYDTSYMVGRFIRHFKPALCVLMETEVWPNLMAQCAQRHVPVALVNARLSARSLEKGLRFPTLFGNAAASLACVAAQTESDAQRIEQLGAKNVHVTGNIKFDVTPSEDMKTKGDALRAQFGGRRVLVCANTRDGEEERILGAMAALRERDFLLVVVPRHPQRFDEVSRLIDQHGFSHARRSTLGISTLAQDIDVLLGDSMGEMFCYYQACDVAFVGGNLLPLGGHNLIEACVLGKPVLIGPHTFNFADAATNAIAEGAAMRVADADELLLQASALLQDQSRCQTMGERASRFAQQHRGASHRTMALLQALVPN